MHLTVDANQIPASLRNSKDAFAIALALLPCANCNPTVQAYLRLSSEKRTAERRIGAAVTLLSLGSSHARRTRPRRSGLGPLPGVPAAPGPPADAAVPARQAGCLGRGAANPAGSAPGTGPASREKRGRAGSLPAPRP